MKILILDTETTGNTEKAQPIEIAFIEIEYPSLNVIRKVDLFFKPSEPISFGAKATHHILESDLIDKPDLTSDIYSSLIEDIYSADYIIAHNVDYDWGIIGKPDIKRIDTLAIARKLLPDLDSKSQSALMYYFFGDEARDKIKNAHNALCDVENCLLILRKLTEIISDRHDYPNEEISIYNNIEELYNFSEYARIPDKMTFGKHKDKTYLEVARADPGYFDWIRYKSDIKPDKYMLKAIEDALANRRKV